MELIDRVFLTVFARYRWTMGESRVNSAWVRAVGKVTGFLILPAVALAFVLVILTYLLSGSGTPADHMRWGKITAIAGWLAIAFLLQARFTKFLRIPPPIAQESHKDRRTVILFRAICVGLFLSICVVAVLLGAVGLRTRLGF